MFPNSSIGIIHSIDYFHDLQCTISSFRTEDNANSSLLVIESLQKFILWLEQNNQISVLESDLLEFLTRKDIQNLINCGYLYSYRNSKANNLYYLSHPKGGEITNTINIMTKYILQIIKRKQYKEIYEEEFSSIIFKNSLNNSSRINSILMNEEGGRKKLKIKNNPRGMKGQNSEGLGWKYHIYDMIGRDLLYRVETGGMKGPLLRIK